MKLELQAIQAKAVTLMCEMFEHICHIMAMVQARKSPFPKIALSMVQLAFFSSTLSFPK
jgi:hypothetical protein